MTAAVHVLSIHRDHCHNAMLGNKKGTSSVLCEQH